MTRRAPKLRDALGRLLSPETKRAALELGVRAGLDVHDSVGRGLHRAANAVQEEAGKVIADVLGRLVKK